MKERFGDLWRAAPHADATCVTTNGAVRRDGAGVMGRGVAAQAKRRFPGIEHVLGRTIFEEGNHVALLGVFGGLTIVSFPVKHHWRERADLGLIERSARELMDGIEDAEWDKVLLPRPGCGNGGLRWADVRPRIEPILDDRVVVVAWPEEVDR